VEGGVQTKLRETVIVRKDVGTKKTAICKNIDFNGGTLQALFTQNGEGQVKKKRANSPVSKKYRKKGGGNSGKGGRWYQRMRSTTRRGIPIFYIWPTNEKRDFGA